MKPMRGEREMLAKTAKGCVTATRRKEAGEGAAAQRGREKKGIRISIMRCSFWAFGSFLLFFSPSSILFYSLTSAAAWHCIEGFGAVAPRPSLSVRVSVWTVRANTEVAGGGGVGGARRD